jgi:hypothetical protein
MSTIKVDTIATRTGSGNITVSNNIAGAGTISGTNITATASGAPLTVNSTNSNNNKIIFQDNGSVVSHLGGISNGLVFANAAGTQLGRLDADGLKFGTDTAAVNALDDYEEGSFTPVPVVTHNPGGVSVSNITQQIGKYIKIGSMVFFHFRIRFDKTGSSGNIGINGMPFAEDSAGVYGNIGMAREGATEGTAYQLESISGTQIGVIRKYDNTSLGTGTKDVQGHGFYRTSS